MPKNGQVTYDQIYDAFIVYAASRNDSDWWDLWTLCQRRMEALVKSKAKSLATPLSNEDFASLIIDSTCRVMDKLEHADDVTPEFISKTFWFENLREFKGFNRSQEKIQKIAKILKKF